MLNLYAFLSDGFLFSWLSFDVIEYYSIVTFTLYSTWFLDGNATHVFNYYYYVFASDQSVGGGRWLNQVWLINQPNNISIAEIIILWSTVKSGGAAAHSPTLSTTYAPYT